MEGDKSINIYQVRLFIVTELHSIVAVAHCVAQDVSELHSIVVVAQGVSEILIYEFRRVSSKEHTEIFFQIKPKSDCVYHFQIDLEPKGRPFGSKSIGAG